MIEATSQELEVLIRARYPLISCVSFEESRVQALIQRVSESRGSDFYIWTRTKGFFNPVTEKTEKIVGPDKALQFISDQKGKFCFLLKDFHPYFKDPSIVRALRDLCSELKVTQKNIVLLSPQLTLPDELTKEVAVLDIPLPDRDEVRSIYQRVFDDLNLRMDQSTEEQKNCIEAALGLTQDEIENILAKSLVKHGRISIDEILAEKRQIVQKSGILDFIPVDGAFDEVGGLDSLKYWLDRRKDGFSERAREINLPSPKGLLMVGIPGCGKSLTATATGAAWKMPLLRLDVGKVFSGLVGSSENNMRNALKTAESVAPCILWIDEIEKGFSGSSSSGQSDSGTTSRVFGSFLTWMQEKTEPVFVLATANDISGLPPELLRKGRFDEIFFVDLPSQKDRLDILHIHLKKRNWEIDELNEDEFLESSLNFSGAEIEQALIDARYESFFHDRPLHHRDLLLSLKKTVPLYKTMEERISSIRAWSQERAVNASEAIQEMREEESLVRKVEMES